MLRREGAVVKKVRSLPQKFILLGFRRKGRRHALGSLPDFRDPWGCSKSYEKQFVLPNSAPDYWSYGLLTGRHREGQREVVKLLKDLHRLLKNPPPPLLKKPPPPLKKRPTSCFPYQTPLLKNPPPLLKNPPPLLKNPPPLLKNPLSLLKSIDPPS